MMRATLNTDSGNFVENKRRAAIPDCGQLRNVYSGVEVVFHGDQPA
jgi:hypothetical protein